MIAKTKSYLEYYLNFFKDRSHSFVDLFVEDEEDGAPAHLGLDAKFNSPPPLNVDPSELMDRYSHPCWCNPELIYCDELKGNEVWLHKRVQ